MTHPRIGVPPPAYCDTCERHSHNLPGINQQCGTVTLGKRCSGLLRSAVTVGDWRECPDCGATGWAASGGRCEACHGCGWLNARRRY